ncbi:MAG: hypothetical protein WDW38_009477 [Sanguina aurantia]
MSGASHLRRFSRSWTSGVLVGQLEKGPSCLTLHEYGANISSVRHLRLESLVPPACLFQRQPVHAQQQLPPLQAASLTHVRFARKMLPFPKSASRSKAPPHNPDTLHVLPVRNFLKEMREAVTPRELKYALPGYIPLTPSGATERLQQLPRIMALLHLSPTSTSSPTTQTAATTEPPATPTLPAQASSGTPNDSTAAAPSIQSLAHSILASLPAPSTPGASKPATPSTPARHTRSDAAASGSAPSGAADDLGVCRDLFERSVNLLDTTMHLFSPQQLASCLRSIGTLHSMHMCPGPALRIVERIHAILVDGAGEELRAGGDDAIVDAIRGLSGLGSREASLWRPVLSACQSVPVRKWSEGQQLSIRESLAGLV